MSPVLRLRGGDGIGLACRAPPRPRRIAVEDVGRAGDVVEAQKRVGDDEEALGDVRPGSRQRHRRLELRDVVVTEVADDGLAQALRLRERDEAVAAADEGMPAEPALVDRLEQERRARRAPSRR